MGGGSAEPLGELGDGEVASGHELVELFGRDAVPDELGGRSADLRETAVWTRLTATGS
ncbi:hypothetical protein [Streptomyces sp. NL15-2K]|uniref:hypothetical protein n=1 Tax=Streptomyces sp. NL15-2K TaxID=376149 RepID=UPI00155A7D9A|nr:MULTISPECIES: hypothetical protein [Actinomycetes]WKX14720.1 hypothetical protein Q4V64_47370 [Kutzneria buriramensis]